MPRAARRACSLLLPLAAAGGLLATPFGSFSRAFAQVSVNPGAVEELAPTPSPSPAAPPAPAKEPARPKTAVKPKPAPAPRNDKNRNGRNQGGPRETAAKKTAPPPPSAPSSAANPLAPHAAAAPPAPPKPPAFTIPQTLDVPEGPPASPLLPPAAPTPPPHPNIPPPPPPVVASAVGEVLHVPGGTRITFAPGSADLNPATDAALREIGAEVAKNPAAVVNVIAYAGGPKDDPSTPRRLSLDRALAARAVLMQAGVPSTRIYVRALGASAGEGPADRVDLVVTTSTATLAATPPAPAAAKPAPPPSSQPSAP